jgi:hypothetical protein
MYLFGLRQSKGSRNQSEPSDQLGERNFTTPAGSCLDARHISGTSPTAEALTTPPVGVLRLIIQYREACSEKASEEIPRILIDVNSSKIGSR